MLKWLKCLFTGHDWRYVPDSHCAYTGQLQQKCQKCYWDRPGT